MSKRATPGIIGERHYTLAQKIRRTLAQYADLKDIIAMLGMEQLSPDDRHVVARAQRLERFLTQPFFTTEQFTGLSVKFVCLKDALDGYERILRDEQRLMKDEGSTKRQLRQVNFTCLGPLFKLCCKSPKHYNYFSGENKMSKIEQLELEAHRGGIISDVKNLVEKYRAIFDWDVPDIDQGYADKLIVVEIRKALDVIEKELLN